jgi:hypothetical protein
MPRHDYPSLIKLIMSSALYVRSSAVDAGAPDSLPIFCAGPLKPMTPEDYVSSMGIAVGRNVGRCDFHTDEDLGSMGYYPDPLNMDIPADPALGGDFHYQSVHPLGGCNGGREPAPQPTLRMIFGAVGVIQTLCAPPSLVAPPDFDPTNSSTAAIDKLVDFQFTRYLGRLPEAGERSAFDRTASVCIADPMCGMAQVPNQLCGAILRSEAFLYY